MQNSFRRLFSLQIAHEYFSRDRICPDLKVVPAGATAELMRNFRMRLRQTEPGAAVYASDQVADKDFPKTPLVFAVTVQNPMFYQYTDLHSESPVDTTAVVYSNSGTTLVPADILPLPVRGYCFRHRLARKTPLPKRGFTLMLHSAHDDAVAWQGQIQGDGRAGSPSGKAPAFSAIDVALPGDVPPGKYTLTVNRTKSNPFVLLDRPAAEVFALVSIHLSSLAGANLVLPLPARRARWRYIVAGAVGGDEIEARDLNTNANIKFNKPKPITIDGKQALIFLSRKALPLIDDPRGRYTIKLKIADASKELPLPLPNAGNMKAAVDGKGKNIMVSEMLFSAEKKLSR